MDDRNSPTTGRSGIRDPAGLTGSSGSTDARPDDRNGLGWLILLPIACCGGPLIVGALAAAGAAEWGGLGAGAVVIGMVAGFIVVRRRRRASCCVPDVPARQPGPARTDHPFA